MRLLGQRDPINVHLWGPPGAGKVRSAADRKCGWQKGSDPSQLMGEQPLLHR